MEINEQASELGRRGEEGMEKEKKTGESFMWGKNLMEIKQRGTWREERQNGEATQLGKKRRERKCEQRKGDKRKQGERFDRPERSRQ